MHLLMSFVAGAGEEVEVMTDQAEVVAAMVVVVAMVEEGVTAVVVEEEVTAMVVVEVMVVGVATVAGVVASAVAMATAVVAEATAVAASLPAATDGEELNSINLQQLSVQSPTANHAAHQNALNIRTPLWADVV